MNDREFLKKMAPGVVKTKADKEKWQRAKEAVGAADDKEAESVYAAALKIFLRTKKDNRTGVVASEGSNEGASPRAVVFG